MIAGSPPTAVVAVMALMGVASAVFGGSAERRTVAAVVVGLSAAALSRVLWAGDSGWVARTQPVIDLTVLLSLVGLVWRSPRRWPWVVVLAQSAALALDLQALMRSDSEAVVAMGRTICAGLILAAAAVGAAGRLTDDVKANR